MNWQQLKDFANSLTAEQLQQEVKAWGENCAYEVVGVEVTTEDLYFNGEWVLPFNEFENPETEITEDTPCLPIGTIRLNID